MGPSMKTKVALKFPKKLFLLLKIGLGLKGLNNVLTRAICEMVNWDINVIINVLYPTL